MFKNCVIFFFLAIAYSVLLAHNFKPHHHSEKAAHHHHDGNGRVHTHTHDGEKNAEDNSNAFQHFEHIGAAEIQYFPVYTKEYSILKQINPTVFWEEFVVDLPHFEKPPLNLSHRPREESPFLSQSLAYFFSLKAPPASSIA